MRKRYRNAALRNFSPPKPRRLEPISHSSHDDPCFPRQTPQIGGSWNALEGESENIGTTHPREIPGPNAPWRSYSSPAAITKNTSPGHSRRIGRSDVSTASVAENVWKGSLTEFYREILMVRGRGACVGDTIIIYQTRKYSEKKPQLRFSRDSWKMFMTACSKKSYVNKCLWSGEIILLVALPAVSCVK